MSFVRQESKDFFSFSLFFLVSPTNMTGCVLTGISCGSFTRSQMKRPLCTKGCVEVQKWTRLVLNSLHLQPLCAASKSKKLKYQNSIGGERERERETKNKKHFGTAKKITYRFSCAFPLSSRRHDKDCFCHIRYK